MPPRPPHRNPTKVKGYVHTNTEGKLYRVRDRDPHDGSPVKIWGDNLPHAEAHLLKERIVGSGKSNSARLEEMTVPAPATALAPQVTNALGSPLSDPVLENARQKALAAGRRSAAAAQARADAKAVELANLKAAQAVTDLGDEGDDIGPNGLVDLDDIADDDAPPDLTA